MKKRTLAYQVTEIPDPFYPKYQMVAGGDVRTAAYRDFEHVLRPIADLPPEAASLAIRFAFTPSPSEGDMQSRLRIYVMARAKDTSVIESLRLLLERGPLSRFYVLKPITRTELPWEKLQAACDISRREDAVNPLYNSEFNNRIPAYYYSIRPFEPNDRNDYLNLDRVLGKISEEVIIDICVQPVDISAELLEHTRYLSRLESINRIWDRGEDDELELHDYVGDNSNWHSNRRKGITPLRYRDPLADDILRSHQRFHESLHQPHLQFHIKVLTKKPAVAQLLGSVVAESAFEEGSYRLLNCSQEAELFGQAVESMKEIRVLTSPTNDSFFPKDASTLYSGLGRLSHTSTVDELLGVFRLPVSLTNSPCCIRKNTDPPDENKRSLVVLGLDKEVPSSSRGIPISQLCKHTFVSGTTGSGKTTSMLNLTLQIHKLGIPFLILEPVKTEYRILNMFRNHIDKNARRLAEKLEIYTPGNESVSPFRFNPLYLQAGISVDEHIDNMLSCFMAAIPVFGPIPALLGEALERVYEDHPDRDSPPIMADLVDAAENVLDEKGYSPDTNSDFRAALEVRIGVLIRRSIGKVFQCRKSVPPIDHLMKVSTIVELDRLHTEQACLLTLFLLTNIREHLRTTPKTTKDPRYVIIIEEAHNIVGKTGRALPSENVADPKAFAAEYVVRMLAELRALGVGIVIVDQFPSAVAPEVIKSTTSKLAFRQVAKDDREELGAAMLFGPTEMEEIARLKTRETFFFTEGYYRPRSIETTDMHDLFRFNTAPSNKELAHLLRQKNWFRETAFQRVFNELSELKEKLDSFEEKKLHWNKKLRILISQHPQILAQHESKNKSKTLTLLKDQFRELGRQLVDAHQLFMKKSFGKYLNCETDFVSEEPLIQEFRDVLENRLKSIIEPDIKKSLDRINRFISFIN